jgi:tricorn protease-like protein
MASELTVKVLANLDVLNEARISPDGTHVVYSVRSDATRKQR